MEAEIKNLTRRIAVLEFFAIFTLSVIFSFIYALTQILSLSWYPVPLAGIEIVFFLICILTLNFLLFVANTFEKVQLNTTSFISTLVNQWKTQITLNKVLIIFGFLGAIISVIQIGIWIIELIKAI